MKQHILFKLSRAVRTVPGLVLLIVAIQIMAAPTVSADPKCAMLSQGAVACPSGLGQGSNNCYFFDPGDPRAGPDAKYPGWQPTSCDSDVYREASKPLGGIEYRPDPALSCSGPCSILDNVNVFVNALAALFGIVVVIAIVVGGIQYASSGDDPQKVSAAKGHITAALVALFAFFLLYAMLQWLVPGGFL